MSKTAPQPRRKWTKAKREFADIAGLLVSNANVCLPAPGDILYQADFCSDDERRQLLQEIQDREFLVAGFDRRIGVQKYALQDENADCPAALQTLAARVQARWNSPRHPTHVLVERYSTTAWSFNGDYAPNHIVTRFETRADLGNNNDDGFAVARVVLTHPVIHHTNRPAEKQELMWTLTTADHHTNLLLPTGSLLVQRGEFLHAWRSYTTAAPDGQAPSIVLKFLCLPIVAADDGGQEIDFGYVASEADRIPRTGVLPALPELLTIIVTTSPIKSHPSTQMLERTFDTFQLAGEDFVDCRKVIVCDGFRHVGTGTVSRKHSNPKQAMRNGIVTEEQANNYIAFKQRLRLLCKGAAVVADSPFRNTSVEELEERMGYGFALRHALRHCVSTPFVCVIQHDRTFMRPTPMRDVVHAMWRHRNIKYVGISMRSNLIYRDIFNSKYGSQEEFEKMVLRPPELLLDASKYGPGGDFHEILSAVVTKDRVLRNLDSFADAYKTSAQCLEQAKWIEANPPPEGKCQLTLTPTLFWYDNTHICETAHYRDFVFDPKYKMVARGGFVEDKLSPVLKRTIERLGLTDGHSRFGCYLLDDHSGYFFTGHLDGGNFIARENNGNLSRSSSDTAQESENLSRSSSDMVQESENLSRSSGDKEPGEESTLEDDTSSVGSDEGLEAEKSPWWSNLAVLGDSMSALMFSAGLVLLSVGFSWYLNMQESLTPEELAYRSLGSIPRPRGSATVYEINPQMTVVEQITEKMKHAYRHDGVLALRGLISPPLLKELQEAADELIKEQHFSNAQKRFKVRGKQFFTVHHGAIFRTPQSLRNHTDQPVDRAPLSSSDPMNNPFLRLMAHTSLSQVGASLLHHTMEDDSHSKDNLRILRDIFLAKDDDPCGYHAPPLFCLCMQLSHLTTDFNFYFLSQLCAGGMSMITDFGQQWLMHLVSTYGLPWTTTTTLPRTIP